MNELNQQSEWPRLTWPINEILLQTLVIEGNKDEQIAQIYRVPTKLVTERREAFGL